MTVQELIIALVAQDPTAEVVIDQNGDGAICRPVVFVAPGFYAAAPSGPGRFYDAGGIWTAVDGVPAVCLDEQI